MPVAKVAHRDLPPVAMVVVLRHTMVRVSRVRAGSIAEELEIVPGTELLSVNGRELRDFLDWEFLGADEELVLEARLPSGEDVVYEIERPDGEPLGVELAPPTVRRCANRCEFCFIEGLPQGLRKNLYVRDDDYRLSFAYGNFATLSNVKERDIERILEYRLSPLYVSVHATPWEARKVLLNNPRVPNIVAQLSRLAAGGIQFHCQMVIVPGLNDGDVLEQSLTDLWTFGDAVLSVAIVPVGLTQFSHLYTGKSMDAARATTLLQVAERWAERARRVRGETWVFGSDELYLLAGQELPGDEHYGDFAQIENGVGAVTALRRRVRAGLSSLPRLDGCRIGVVTGVSMAPLMPELLGQLTAATGARFQLITVENSLFGPTTTTAGLLVGADMRRALADRHDLDLALIPAETINDDGVFLDDDSFIAVREALPMPVYPSYDFVDVLAHERANQHSTARDGTAAA
jgi:putative radical SAM enzyme (TIGR03279 family)